MHLINFLKLATLYLGLFVTRTTFGNECFRVSLPHNATDIRVPSSLALVRVDGEDTMTPAGFWIFHSGENLALSGPGSFCLDQDIVRNVGFAALLGEPGGFGPLVELSNSGIVLDLNGHKLRSDRAGIAIKGYVSGNVQRAAVVSFTFRNGTIQVSGAGIAMTGWQYISSAHTYRPGPRQIESAIYWYGQNFRQFGDTNILLENLTIKSGDLAAYLVGRNNIVRHCRIEVDGHEAVALLVANAQLLDNEIIVKRKLSPPKHDNSMPELGTYYPESAAIWIRDAPGAIIRGNKITVKGRGLAEQAILLVNSPNVVIENNEVTGVKKLYAILDERSSALSHDNRKRIGKWQDK